MKITGATKIVGLMGSPVEHSFSPLMHNRAFEKLNMDYVYVPFDVEPSKLKSAIEGAESLNIQGLNVTIPHKIEVMKYLNELDEIARLIGAVNTIDIKNLKGYNTDGIGAVKAIEEVTSLKNKNVVVLGSGGASRAISFYLAKYKIASLNILNRNVKKARSLADDILKSQLLGDVCANSLEDKFNLDDTDILINTTPLGMSPNINVKPLVKAEEMHEELTVFDAVYNPSKTVLIKEALKAGAKPVYGIKMLLYQGAESFKIWTGCDAPLDVMENVLKEKIGE